MLCISVYCQIKIDLIIVICQFLIWNYSSLIITDYCVVLLALSLRSSKYGGPMFPN